MKKRKLLIISNSMEMGGSERSISQLLQYLDYDSLSIDLALVFDKNIFYSIPQHVEIHILQHMESQIIPQEQIEIPSHLVKSADQFVWMETTALKLAHIVQRISPDVVLANHYFSAMIALMSRKHWPQKISLICTAQSYATTMFSQATHGQLYEYWGKKYFSRADFFVAVSNMVKQDLRENFGVNTSCIRVIHNAIDLEEIDQLIKEPIEHPWFDEGDFLLTIAVGRLHTVKGYDYLLRAFALAIQSGMQARLVLVGDGEDRKKLETLAQELSIDSHVLFLGAKKNPFKYLAKSDIFVLSSLREGFPNVLAEAMACGCSVIATDCPSGPKEILENGQHGLLVPPTNEKALAEAIIRLGHDQELRSHLAELGRKRAQAFDVTIIMKQYEELIADTIKQKSCPLHILKRTKKFFSSFLH